MKRLQAVSKQATCAHARERENISAARAAPSQRAPPASLTAGVEGRVKAVGARCAAHAHAVRVGQLHPRRRRPGAHEDARRVPAARARRRGRRAQQIKHAVDVVARHIVVEAGQRRVWRVGAAAALVEAVVVQREVRAAHGQAARAVADAGLRVEVEARHGGAVRGRQVAEVQAGRLREGAAEAVHDLEARRRVHLDRKGRREVGGAPRWCRRGREQLQRLRAVRARVHSAHNLRPRRQRGGGGGGGGGGARRRVRERQRERDRQRSGPHRHRGPSAKFTRISRQTPRWLQ